MIGTYVLSAGFYDAYYLQGAEGPDADRSATSRRRWRGIDVILTPTTPSAAFALGEKAEAIRCRCI